MILENMIYFISDVHLGFFKRQEDKKREDRLLNFLNDIKKDCSTLLIVGDLFDYWFEYKTVIPREFYRTLTALESMSKSGIKIEYLMGNHDFGHFDFFEKELGIKVFENDIVREYSGKKFYISHGDGKSYNDTGYKIIKKITRNNFAKRLYCRLHPDWGIGMASGSSRHSRSYTDVKNYGTKDGMSDFAEIKIKEGFDYVVMGHRHKAEIKEFGSGKYINLGEWIKKPSYGKFDGKEFIIEFLNK